MTRIIAILIVVLDWGVSQGELDYRLEAAARIRNAAKDLPFLKLYLLSLWSADLCREMGLDEEMLFGFTTIGDLFRHRFCRSSAHQLVLSWLGDADGEGWVERCEVDAALEKHFERIARK